MKILPFGCDGTVAPWGGNYCKAWLAYHGIFFAAGVGLLGTGYFADSPETSTMGGCMMAAALLVGTLNWLVDRGFGRAKP